MKARVIHGDSRYLLILMLQILFACDYLDKDDIYPTLTQSDYYSIPGSSIIIDLTSLGNQSFTNASVKISKEPASGQLTQVDELLFKYKPRADLMSGEDQIDITVASHGKTVATHNVKIHIKSSREQFPCALITIEDKVATIPGATISIPVLENDWLCNVDKSSLNISIHAGPLYGENIVEGESIKYIPSFEYKGQDEFTYKLTSTANEEVYYGIVSIVDPHEFTIQTVPVSGPINKIVFTNENVGYAVGNAIYKTTDGGQAWFRIFHEEGKNITVNDIYFLNEKEGFMIYACRESVLCQNGENRLAVTKDGGQSWETRSVNTYPTSVLFTSPSSGFMAGVYEDELYGFKTELLKTDDGGEHWERVLDSHYEWGESPLEIEFVDTSVGFVYQMDRIFRSMDGGKSWKILTGYDHVASMAVVGPEKVFANVTTIGSFNNPSEIVKFQGPLAPTVVADIPYKIYQLGFSPSGNVGFGVGITDNVLRINRSLDKGESWEEVAAQPLNTYHFGLPIVPNGIAVPSDDVLYVLYSDNIMRFTF